MPLTAAPIGPVRVLLVEDSPEDAELTCEQLLEAGLEAEFQRVDSEAGLRLALERFKPDLVLSDLSMPGFSGHDALKAVLALDPPVPFIFVSGTMGRGDRGPGAARWRGRLHPQGQDRAPALGGGRARSASRAASVSASGWKKSCCARSDWIRWRCWPPA